MSAFLTWRYGTSLRTVLGPEPMRFSGFTDHRNRGIIAHSPFEASIPHPFGYRFHLGCIGQPLCSSKRDRSSTVTLRRSFSAKSEAIACISVSGLSLTECDPRSTITNLPSGISDWCNRFRIRSGFENSPDVEWTRNTFGQY